MFTDEQTNVDIYASLDESLVSGTMRTCDLVPVFLDAIKDTAEYLQITMSNNWNHKVIFDAGSDDQDERWDSEDIAYLLEELFDTLNSYAPTGYYFGSHIGNGSDYGFWKIEN